MESKSAWVKEVLGFILRGMVASIVSVVAVFVWIFPASLIGMGIATDSGEYAEAGESFMTISSIIVVLIVSFLSFYLYPAAVGSWKLSGFKRALVSALGAGIVAILLYNAWAGNF